jgi:hypothetical protein
MKIKKLIVIPFAFLLTQGLSCAALSDCIVLPRSAACMRRVAAQAPKEKISVRISGAALSINAREVPLPINTTRLVELLGRPDRITRLQNVILTWDNDGILAYERPDTDRVFQLSIALGMKRFEFWPSRRFSGVLTIDGARITPESSLIEVNRIKSGRKFVQGSLNFIWEIGYVDRKISINKGTIDTYDNSGKIIEVVVENLK